MPRNLVKATKNKAHRVYDPPTKWDYRGLGVVYCTHFGCGKELTIREQLFGSKCIHHSIK